MPDPVRPSPLLERRHRLQPAPAPAVHPNGPAPLAPAVPVGPPVAPPMAPSLHNQVTVSVAAPPPVVITGLGGPGLFVRLFWMAFIGWWLGPIVAVLGWLLLLPVVTLPLGVAVLARVPKAASLRPTDVRATVRTAGVDHRLGNVPQRAWWQRILWMYPLGLFFGGLWILLGCFFLFPLWGWLSWPLGIAILDRAPAVMTLHRN